MAQIDERRKRVVCLQELFTGYFCGTKKKVRHDITERIPDGPATRLMQSWRATRLGDHSSTLRRGFDWTLLQHGSSDRCDGKFLSKFRKVHLPHYEPGFWEKFYFRPGNSVIDFETKVGKIGVISAMTAISQKAGGFGLAGAEIVFNPSATGWAERVSLETGTNWRRRPHLLCRSYQSSGHRSPWNIGEFYGQSILQIREDRSWRNARRTTLS